MSMTNLSSNLIMSLSDTGAAVEIVGGKGASLARLAAAGLPIPAGFFITTEGYKQFVEQNNLQAGILAALEQVNLDRPATLETASAAIREMFARAQTPPGLASLIVQAYESLSREETAGTHNAVPVAVRSSATAEDLPGLSFAGQQDTYLNIHGADAVLAAVKRCWASLWTARAIGYRARNKIDQSTVSLAVVVQILVPAEAAGILFTANPVNGRRDQAMISAAWGLGEAIVGGLVTPDTLTVDKAAGSILEQQIADKEKMTVRTAGGTQEQSVPEQLRRIPVLDAARAAALVRAGVQIETLYGTPMDIEWALAGGSFFILQARPITTQLQPEAPTTIEWKLPNPKGQYMRGSIVDLMPDPVSPLFATLAIPAISRVGVKEVLRPLTRSEPLLPDDYIAIINEYAYMGITYNLRQWGWIITRMLFAMPRMLRESLPLWRDHIRPRYVDTVAHWQGQSFETMPAAALWSAVQQVNDAAMLHLSALLVATTGASAGAEGLFTRIYEKMIRRGGGPAAVTFLMGYDSTPIQAEKSLYDLAHWIRDQDELAKYLLETPLDQLTARLAAGPAPVSGWDEFARRFDQHQKTYGHIIYDLDFARPLPLDDPTPKLDTILMYLKDQGVNPHERQHAAEARRVQAKETTLRQLKGLRKWAFQKTLDMAQSMAQVRENALSDIGLGYPVLRKMLQELGGRLANAGLILHGDDIYWLKADEVQQAVALLEQREPVPDLAGVVAQRKAYHQLLKQAVPPPTLPPKKKYLGVDMAAFTPAAEDSHTGSLLKGVPSSAGRVTARACVLRGPEDFDQMKPGDVLVAATTTPAWTPLFSMASAVVTDIGGPLSHGSIVAREFGIPAVLGTGVATRRIRSGQTVTVDGSAGTVEMTEFTS